MQHSSSYVPKLLARKIEWTRSKNSVILVKFFIHPLLLKMDKCSTFKRHASMEEIPVINFHLCVNKESFSGVS